MHSAEVGTSKRMLRVLLAGGALALAWTAFDLATHSEPAAAAASIDLLGEDSLVSDILTPVTEEIVTPVVEHVVVPVVDPVVTPVVTPVLTPTVAAVAVVTAPVVEVIQPVIEPISTIVAPVIEPVLPVVETITVIDVVADLAPTLAEVQSITPNGTILATGGLVIVGVVLAASLAPLLPAPINGGPFNAPLAPAAPTGSNSSSSVALYGELTSGVPAGIGASGTHGARVDDLPSSMTFDSDTTPD